MEKLNLLINRASYRHIISLLLVQVDFSHFNLKNLQVLRLSIQSLGRPIIAIDCILVVVKLDGEIGALEPLL